MGAIKFALFWRQHSSRHFVSTFHRWSIYYNGIIIDLDHRAPKKFTSTIDSIAVSEEMLAEGMVGMDLSNHPDADILTSDLWGSYFHCPPRIPTASRVAAAAVTFRNLSASVTGSSSSSCSRATTPLKRVCSMREAAGPEPSKSSAATTLSPGPMRINTLWGTLIRDHARMCIPDLEVLVNYPIDYRFPAFGWSKKGELVSSGFFPADPSSLHKNDMDSVKRI